MSNNQIVFYSAEVLYRWLKVWKPFWQRKSWLLISCQWAWPARRWDTWRGCGCSRRHSSTVGRCCICRTWIQFWWGLSWNTWWATRTGTKIANWIVLHCSSSGPKRAPLVAPKEAIQPLSIRLFPKQRRSCIPRTKLQLPIGKMWCMSGRIAQHFFACQMQRKLPGTISVDLARPLVIQQCFSRRNRAKLHTICLLAPSRILASPCWKPAVC